MGRPYDARLIMMVAQQPFETADLNQFCKLIPLVFVDGTQAEAADYMNDGEIWWMLTAQTARLAAPGRLLVGMTEDAVRYEADDPNSSCYQVKRDSVQDLQLRDGMEVIDLPGDAIASIEDVVSGGFAWDMVTHPTPNVLLRWRAQLFGPFLASRRASATSSSQTGFVFAPANTTDMAIFRVEEAAFNDATKGHRIAIADEVSMSSHRRSEGIKLTKVSHDLVLASGYERILVSSPEKLILEPLDRKLHRYARQCLTRKKRQEFQALLNDMELTGRESEEAQGLLETLNRIRQVTKHQEGALDAVAKALLASGMLGEERIGRAEQFFAGKYVQERTAELQAKVEENLAAKRDELRRAEVDLKDVQSRLKKEESQLRHKLEQELAAEREKSRQSLAAERDEFEKQKAELERQQNLLQGSLQKVTKELREAGDEVVNRFLTIAPLLGSLGSGNDRPVRSEPPAAAANDGNAVSATFDMPAFLVGGSRNIEGELNEAVFFDRFQRVVENGGFVFRPLDLQRFHVSIKSGDLTVLGGPSGTGKSSLPPLYSQALLGDSPRNGRPGCLMVNVNPSWMDTRDLLGHTNTVEGRFYPAESGIFEHLLYAQEEHAARGTATGIYLVCLDEMNLSQVEHYFSDFMMVLERTGAGRTIQCYSANSVNDRHLFPGSGRVTLSPALRFAGTVNFDETTRLLSDRFLDRVNLIRLGAAALPGVGGADTLSVSADGRMVTLADFETWRNDSALPTDLGSLLDQIRPLLSQMGCPVSPRVYRGICRFVGSAMPVMSQPQAFDAQVAQRILPRIRSLVTRRQLDALDELTRLLNQSNVCSFEESIPLIEDIRETARTRGWNLEE